MWPLAVLPWTEGASSVHAGRGWGAFLTKSSLFHCSFTQHTPYSVPQIFREPRWLHREGGSEKDLFHGRNSEHRVPSPSWWSLYKHHLGFFRTQNFLCLHTEMGVLFSGVSRWHYAVIVFVPCFLHQQCILTQTWFALIFLGKVLSNSASSAMCKVWCIFWQGRISNFFCTF